ncbi:hypothetical protein V8Z74_14970 [Comamonas sp. w2-DMI]|uniref:hypothetical protein n=1 Tax=Comamonas sp. w2-DMI TaxID=3126391 RepID=UPI0032E4E4D9
MPAELFSVFERDGEKVGISEFGESRNIIFIKDGVVVNTKVICLHELGSHIAALNRSGFDHTLNGAFFNESACTFAMRHADFQNRNYLVFVQETGNVQSAVARIEAIGLKGLRGDQRKHFDGWLRSLDLSSDYLVASDDDPAPVLALSEYAREKSLCLYASRPGIPAAAPSADQQSWVRWLSPMFSEAKVLETFSLLWSNRPFLNPAQAVSELPDDPLSFPF